MKNIQKDFAGIPVINRGFGGSKLADSTYFADRIIVPYHPAMVLVYAGDNDLAGGETPQALLDDYRQFVDKVRGSLPEVRIAFVSIKPSIARWKLIDKIREANRLIRDYSKRKKGLLFIDISGEMLGDDGQPKPELFKSDGLHPSDACYTLWAKIIRPYIERDPKLRAAK